MKRQEQIDRLVAVGHNPLELRNMSNANIRVIYEQAKALMEARAAVVQRQREREAKLRDFHNREMKRLHKLKEKIKEAMADSARQEAWMRRCYECGRRYDPIVAHVPRPCLDFGLAVFIAHAQREHKQTGNQDAAATLRVITNPNWRYHGIKVVI